MPHTVLCVDDDRNLCQIFAKALVGEGYQVRTAHDGEEAIAAVRAERPDLVLLDLLLPRRDGFAVLEAIRALPGRNGPPPAIVISGCSRTPEYLRRAQVLGARTFLTKPVPLDALLEAVRKELEGSSGGGAASRPAARRNRTRGVTLKGSLADLVFPALLHHFHGLRATGALHLRSMKRRKVILIRDGHAVAVKSNLVSECLGNLLVRMGRITREQLTESLKRVRRGEGLQGEILVAMEVLDEGELATALRVQAQEKLFEIFEWADGEFRFDRDGDIEGANALAVDTSTANIILGGVRSRFPLTRVDAHLAAHAERLVVRSENPFYRFQEIALEPAQEELLARLEQGVRLSELTGLDEESRRVVYGLLITELVELRDADGAAPAPKAAGAARPRRRSARAGDERVRAGLARMAERMRGQTYFQVLGLGIEAKEEEIEAAYADLAHRTHPDWFSGWGEVVQRLAEEVFRVLSTAHETLTDSQLRQTYIAELRRGERAAEAREEGRRALEAEKKFQEGDAALRGRDYATAVRCFDRACDLFPKEGNYLAHLGWSRYLAAGGGTADALREAVNTCHRAAKLAPDREKPYLFLGRLLKAAGRDDSTQRMFTRALQIRPECVEALRELRLLNMRMDKRKGLIRRLLRR